MSLHRKLGIMVVLLGAACGPSGPAGVAVDRASDTSSSSAPRSAASVDGLTEDEIPSEAMKPSQRGTRGVRSFAGFLDTIREQFGGFPAPRPATMRVLTDQVGVVLRGTVTKAEFVPHELHLGDLRGASIDLVLTVSPTQTIKKGADPVPTQWATEVFTGDPVLVRLTLAKLATELGTGPLGADVLLYGNPEPALDQFGVAGGGRAGIYDGIIEDAEARTRLALVPGTPKELDEGIAAALAATSGR